MQTIEAILRGIEEVAAAYHRLLLLVGETADMSRCLVETSSRLNRPVLNLNAELAAALLEVPQRQRQLKAHKVIGDIIDGAGDGVVLFDHTDILFSPALQLDALALLKSASRNKMVVAAWPGVVRGGKLQHAEEWHPEYQCHSIEDIKVVAVGE